MPKRKFQKFNQLFQDTHINLEPWHITLIELITWRHGSILILLSNYVMYFEKQIVYSSSKNNFLDETIPRSVDWNTAKRPWFLHLPFIEFVLEALCEPEQIRKYFSLRAWNCLSNVKKLSRTCTKDPWELSTTRRAFSENVCLVCLWSQPDLADLATASRSLIETNSSVKRLNSRIHHDRSLAAFRENRPAY